MRHRTVRDVMTPAVVTVALDTPAKIIAELLEKHQISAAPVLDARHNLVGIVSETDLLHKITYQDDADDGPRLLRRHRIDREKARGTVAKDLMTAPAATILPDASIVEAATQMERRGVKRLPVVDGVGELVGIISRRDLVRVFVRADQEIHDEVVADVIHRALLLPPGALSVEVADGVVTLRGQVTWRSEKVLARELTHRVDGVVHVADELTYLTDDPVYAM